MDEKPAKRRLPVISNAAPKASEGSTAEEEESRPEWQWVGFGVVAMFFAWLPLAAAAGMVARKSAEAVLGSPVDSDDAAAKIAALSDAGRRNVRVAYIAPQVVALVVAAGFAGFVIGRFGKGGARGASFAATLVCIVAAVLSVRDLASLAGLLVMLVLSIAAARGGAYFGERRRNARNTSAGAASS